MSAQRHILMCPAEFSGIEYEINPWMHADNPVNQQLAKEQWQAVYDIYTKQLGWKVDLCKPIKHLPDMVFATDSCLIIDGKILLANFRYDERQPEVDQYQNCLRNLGFTNIQRAKHKFEGGDNLLCGNKILAGWGFRSDPEAADELEEYFGLEVVRLRLIDPYFYHTDTAVAVLSPDTVAVYPDALDLPSQQRLRAAIPNVIEVTKEEADSFTLNVVSDGLNIITSNESESLLQKYRDAGFNVIGTPISEFKKSGGGVKCMTLVLNPGSVAPLLPVEARPGLSTASS